MAGMRGRHKPDFTGQMWTLREGHLWQLDASCLLFLQAYYLYKCKYLLILPKNTT